MRIIIKNGRVVDPGRNMDESRDVLIEDGLVRDLVRPGQGGDWAADGTEIEAGGRVVTPGLIDMHVHLREPGYEYKETIATGTAAAAAGGFSAVASMPNTRPVCDERSVVEFILRRASEAGSARVYPVAAMTRGSQGSDLCEYSDLAEAGARAVSDDGQWVENPRVMRRVLEYARVMGLPAISHAEDHALSGAGVINEGRVSSSLGLAGIPAASEDIAVYRDIRLVELTGAPLHVAHVSTAGAVDLIRRAKERGLPVTAETAPHYFTLTEEAVTGYRTRAKMKPPLRTERDVAAIRAGLADGTLDAVATDHAPHADLEKDVEFDQAAFGIIGLETALPLVLALVREGVLGLSRAIAALTVQPAAILGVPGGALTPGTPADLTVIDLDRTWTVNREQLKSKSLNTPFLGWDMIGRAVLTMTGGVVTHDLLRSPSGGPG